VVSEVTDEHRNSNVRFGLCSERSYRCVALHRGSGLLLTVTNLGVWIAEESGFDIWQGQEVLISQRRFILFWCPSSPLSIRHSGALSVGIKQVGSENNQSPPSNFKAKNAWSHTSVLTHNSNFKCV
jgi:hypothetical protein